MTWHVGGEDAHYDAPVGSHDCPYTAVGFIECWCDGPVYPDDARDWLRAHGIEADTLHHVEVIVAVEENHPDGWCGFWDECAEAKARRLVFGFTNDYVAVVEKARAA